MWSVVINAVSSQTLNNGRIPINMVKRQEEQEEDDGVLQEEEQEDDGVLLEEGEDDNSTLSKLLARMESHSYNSR
jgi:hypothetical protein